MLNHTFNAQQHQLQNGLQLVTIQKDTKIASINVGIKTGALHEQQDEKGICHFIEHMMFKGTKIRDNHKINQDIEDRGGYYTAYTDYNSTVFSITALAEELEDSTEILSDIMINTTFPKTEIEKERGVILAEIRTSIDNVEDFSFSRIHDLAFKESPLKYDVIGHEKTVKSFTREQLIRFYNAHYIPNNCIITTTSPYDHGVVKALIEKYFSMWSIGKHPSKKIICEKHQPVERVSYKKNIEQNTVMHLYTFHGLERKEELALDILNHKLGESPNCILFRTLREERGLAYDVYSQMDTSEYIKTLYIYTAVGEEDVEEAKEAIYESIEKIKSREIPLDERDIRLMKKVIKTSIASILEDSSALGNYVLHQKMTDKPIDEFNEDLRLLDHIQATDIQKISDRILKNPTVHILKTERGH